MRYRGERRSSSTCSPIMESIIAVTREESTAVKQKMSDTHDEQSHNNDEETVETPFTEPHTTLIDSGITGNVPSKPTQDTLMNKIGLLQQRINILTEAMETGIAKDDVHDEIKKLRKELKGEEKRLKMLSVQKFSSQRKTECQRNNPDAAQCRTGSGQPLSVDLQLALLETIINIAIRGSATDECRLTEMIKSCLTLSDLDEMLLLMGFQQTTIRHHYAS
ncbi:hypothetical protein HHI36_011470 [Cryptolaemus montrouzieri]|uniref:Uncharacterized protein n=1 Tax=Cryptolaemus montrouzieri TaxID=559131 RepID=A0ABD2MLS4_9CUCU